MKETFKIFFCLIRDLMEAKEISRDYLNISKAHLSINKIFSLFQFSQFLFQLQVTSVISESLESTQWRTGVEVRIQVTERLDWEGKGLKEVD